VRQTPATPRSVGQDCLRLVPQGVILERGGLNPRILWIVNLNRSIRQRDLANVGALLINLAEQVVDRLAAQGDERAQGVSGQADFLGWQRVTDRGVLDQKYSVNGSGVKAAGMGPLVSKTRTPLALGLNDDTPSGSVRVS